MLNVSITVDTRNLGKKFTALERKQIPFAASLTLNDVAFDARKNEQKRMVKDLDRPTPFTVRGVQVKKASKRRLESRVLIEKKRARYLKYQIHGGTRRPKGRALVIPGRAVRLNKYGNVPGFRKFAGREKAKANVNTVQFDSGLGGLLKTTARTSQVRAIYVSQARYRKRLRFYEPIIKTVRARFPIHFKRRMRQAVRTAR